MESEETQSNTSHASESHGRDLTTGSIPRLLIAFTIPMLVGNVLQALHSLVNAYWVKFLGSRAIAAVTDIMPVFFILMALAIGLTMASSILASQSYGAKDFCRLRKIVENSAVLVGITSVLCAGASYFFAEPILVLMQTDVHVLPIAVSYLRIFIWCMPFMFGMFLMSSLLRGVGDSKTPVYFQSGSLILNAILDPVLMFGWLGLPKMGINGTAVATIVAQICALTALLIYLRSKKHLVLPSLKGLTLDPAISLLTFKIGVPSIIQHSVVSIAIAVTIGLVNIFGEASTAGFGIASRIDQFAFFPAMSIGMAAATLSGQNIGAHRYDRVKEVFKWGAILGWAITIPMSVVLVAFPHSLVSPFVKPSAESAEVIRMGVQYLRIVGAGYAVLTLLFVSNGVINGAGKTLITTIISVVGLLAVRVPLAKYLSEKMHSPDGIWYAMVAGFVIGLVMSLTYYYSGRWKSSVIDDNDRGDDIAVSDESACGNVS